MSQLGGRLQAECTLMTEPGCQNQMIGYKRDKELSKKAEDTGNYYKKNAEKNLYINILLSSTKIIMKFTKYTFMVQVAFQSC